MRPLLAWLSVFFVCPVLVQSQVFISEILFNPPGKDLPNEYIELRGTPNWVLPEGTYFLCVEGDTNGNAGLIQNRFDLSRQRLGGNGFLVLLQKDHLYQPDPKATVLANEDDGEGWGSGSSSSIEHDGEDGQTSFENGTATYYLIHADTKPSVGDDIDADDDGWPEAEFYQAWNIWDSVGVLNGDGEGDIAYGAINFFRESLAVVTNVIIPVGFSPDYVARTGNTTGYDPADWVSGGRMDGVAPDYALGNDIDTEPASFSGSPLDHLGRPNFGAEDLPGIVILPTAGSTVISEDGQTDTYTIGLNTMPTGPVEIQLTLEGQALWSSDQGLTFASSNVVVLTNMDFITIELKAIDDDWVEPSPHTIILRHAIVNTLDEDHYPIDTIIPDVRVEILDNERVLLSELKINPPGEDSPFEFIEIKGPPGAILTNIFLVALEGDSGNDPGTANVLVDLTTAQLGGNGLLMLVPSTNPYPIVAETTYWPTPQLDHEGGGFSNGSVSFLLLGTEETLQEGEDLDSGDNGKAEDLPEDMFLMDAVGWRDGDTSDFVYGGVELVLATGTPDAASRLPGHNDPLSVSAWFCGNLLGSESGSLIYDPRRSTTNFPSGSAMTPGGLNQTAPSITLPLAFSGVIDDPTNPILSFTVTDDEALPESIVVTVESDNEAVVPQGNLILDDMGDGQYTLTIDPVGVGYATVTVRADDGNMPGFVAINYAASQAGLPSSRFHVGATDASTAIPIPPDLMFVGDDENQTIRLYPRHFSGMPVNGFDMNPFLALTDFEDGRPREVDIEGSTRVGDRIYWVGSHSHANIGEIRTNRSRVFATDVSGSGAGTTLTYVGHYEHLKADLVDWDQNNRHGKGEDYYGLALGASDGLVPKDPYGRGFNIEGLAMAPGSATTAWLGFRAPIVPATNRVFALIVPVTNFHEVAISGVGPGVARFGEPIELDFQGRGIRSIEGDTNGYLIVTGPPGDIPTPFPPSDFKLYTWSGNPQDRPEQLAADLFDLNPEAIVELPPHPWNEMSQFQIISDNGRMVYYDDGIQGKFLPYSEHKKFRSDIITFGPVVKPRPFVTSILVAGEPPELTVSWRSNPGDTYRIQIKGSLTDAWMDLSGDIVAADVITSATFSEAPDRQGFYQIVLLP